MQNDSTVVANRAALALPATPSAVAWPAVFAGATLAAALSLILLALGSGLGLSSVSPWAYSGTSIKALGIGAIVWLLVMAGASSALGGYLTGRLRTRWPDVTEDESYFRDTANGLLAWAIATIVSAALLASAASAMVGTAASAGAAATSAVASEVAQTTSNDDGRGYFIDSFFRTTRPADPGADVQSLRSEAGRILARGISQGELPPADRSHLAALIERRTGLNTSDAEKRVDEVVNSAKTAADSARKVAAGTALWVFVSLLLGAFLAAYFAMVGGRHRFA